LRHRFKKLATGPSLISPCSKGGGQSWVARRRDVHDSGPGRRSYCPWPPGAASSGRRLPGRVFPAGPRSRAVPVNGNSPEACRSELWQSPPGVSFELVLKLRDASGAKIAGGGRSALREKRQLPALPDRLPVGIAVLAGHDTGQQRPGRGWPSEGFKGRCGVQGPDHHLRLGHRRPGREGVRPPR